MRQLSRLAQEIGVWLVRSCGDGLPKSFGEDVAEAFPDARPDEIKLALAELEEDGLVTRTALINAPLGRARPTARLFAIASLPATGHDAMRDAVELANDLLSDPNYRSIHRLFDAKGWDHQRFNQAFQQLMRLFDEGRYSKSGPVPFPTGSVIIGDRERLRLARFIGDNK